MGEKYEGVPIRFNPVVIPYSHVEQLDISFMLAFIGEVQIMALCVFIHQLTNYASDLNSKS